ncbi:hypothetical protein COU80_02840 [Candidatus Peregrinibacteria bacterium CG10_big_fil_rev_8_21_14_0_10_55_24]|nr:MAG: hypothetical protein COU80_02840 [Candidatus Peregrinibacteria bacterium CG10_big_fil_rev_8_21_14_0_10_55_24]
MASVGMLQISLRAQLNDLETVSTATGALAEPVPTREEQRENRARGFLLRFQSSRSEQQAQQVWFTEHWQKTLAYEAQCREEIRHSNRDQRLGVILRCFRTQLTLDGEWLRRERRSVENRAGLSNEIRTELLAAIDTMQQAIATILDGIDTGVFQTEESCSIAKQNLATLYRTPLWLAETHARADVLLTWIAHILVQALPTAQDEGEDPSVGQTLRCLSDAETALTEVTAAKDLPPATTELEEAFVLLHTCLRVAENEDEYHGSAPVAEVPEVTVPAQSEPEMVKEPEPEPEPAYDPYLPRPLRRQLSLPITPPLRGVLY